MSPAQEHGVICRTPLALGYLFFLLRLIHAFILYAPHKTYVPLSA
jgi:hypothetical protein